MPCPVCNADVDDVMKHSKEEARKGDPKHQEAVEMEEEKHKGHGH